MEIITRQQAIERQLSKYFTGKPCGRNHIAQRYTINCGCIHCVHPRFSTAHKSQMISAKFRVYNDDLDLFKNVVYAASIGRESRLRPGDIESRAKPLRMSQGRFIRAFRIFPQDEPMLRELERSLEAGRPETLNPNQKFQLPGGDGKQ